MNLQQQLEKGKEPVALRISMLAPQLNCGLVMDGLHQQKFEVTFAYIRDVDNNSDFSINRAGFYHNYYDEKNKFHDICFKGVFSVLDGKPKLQTSFEIITLSDMQDIDMLAVKVKAAQSLTKKYDALCAKFGAPDTAEQAISFLAGVVKANHFFMFDASNNNAEKLYMSPGIVRDMISEKCRLFLDKALPKAA